MSGGSTAPVNGPRWGARARDWAELTAGHARPAWEELVEVTGAGPSTSLLDVGCGSGELLALAAARGARVAGIDAAEAMVELARAAVPGADLRAGGLEELPWPDDAFDVVTGVNAFQFAADPAAALAEARRVTRPGGTVAVCGWGAPDGNELFAVLGALRDLQPDVREGAPTVGPGEVLGMIEPAGLRPVRTADVDVPVTAPDLEALQRALLAPGPMGATIEHAGEGAVREAVAQAAQPFRTAGGGYRFACSFRYVLATT